MARFANHLAPKELHDQRAPFTIHGANFRNALTLATQLRNENAVAALTQSLAAFAQHSRDFSSAARLFEALAASLATEGQGREAAPYHQLGIIAQEQRDFATAERWYLKSLAIEEKQGDEHGAASTYHQLGRIAEEQRDFATAERWYLKSLTIVEKQGNEHAAAGTYHQLGALAFAQNQFESAAEQCLKAIIAFSKARDERYTKMALSSFVRCLHSADSSVRQKLRERWQTAGLERLANLAELEKKSLQQPVTQNL